VAQIKAAHFFVMLGRRKVPFSRSRIRIRFLTHAEHSQAVEVTSIPGMADSGVREEAYKDTLYVLGVKDIWESVTGTRIIKRTVIMKKRAMWPVSS